MAKKSWRTWSLPSAAAVVLLAGWLLIGGCGPAWKSDPAVKTARMACARQPEVDRYACIEQQAVASLNPEMCHLLGIAVDDACLQAVFEAAGDPAICDRIYLHGAALACRTFYSRPTLEPGQLGGLRQPEGPYLAECAPETARSLDRFAKALATPQGSFIDLCRQVGRPAWETGSGLAIYVYDLEDGSQVWLGYGGIGDLVYAHQITLDGQRVDLLAK